MGKQKKLMLLGGIRYLLPVIKAAHEQGYYVITADYLPDNIAHKYSDEYVNVSIIDKEAVLEVAREKEIDGIMSFGVDPGVIAASYVQNQMGLPSFGPFESVVILQNKDKFRAFLRDNGFNVPWAFGFVSVEEALLNKTKFSYPLIVKPTDSAGSMVSSLHWNMLCSIPLEGILLLRSLSRKKDAHLIQIAMSKMEFLSL